MKRTRARILSIFLSFVMVFSLLPISAFAGVGDTGAASCDMRIFHLDCGRKYFSVDQIEAIIDEMAKDGYNYLELAVGNNGLRFLLDDLSLTVNGNGYTSAEVTAAIKAGNESYTTGSTGELTEAEMDAIIAYANSKGISIIPLINTPGHMTAILSAAKTLTGESFAYNCGGYGTSTTTIDVTNSTAVAFTQALLQKYINYFKTQGCAYFNIGADEYANDKLESYSGMGFGYLQNQSQYGYFIKYVNEVAAMIRSAGMIPMVFNDGIEYGGTTSATADGTTYSFDKNILVCYWTSGWPGYAPNSASNLVSHGFSIINTNDAWYYVLGRDSGTYGYSSLKVDSTKYTSVPGDSSAAVTPVGCMICLWCDTPSAPYDSTEVARVTSMLATFASSNSAVFQAANTGEPTETRSITVPVNASVTDTISGSNLGTGSSSDAYASCEYTGQETVTNDLFKITDAVTNGSSYVIQTSEGTYLTSTGSTTTDPEAAAAWTFTTNSGGYRLQCGSNYLRYSSGLTSTTKSKNATTFYFNNGNLYRMNSTPFVRQYDILSNKWGVLLCQKEYQTNDIRRNSREWL